MRIVIDLQGCQTESRFRGIGRYSMALTKEIVKQAEKHEVWLVLTENLPKPINQIRTAFDDLIPQNHIVSFRTPYPVSIGSENAWRIRAAELLREAFLADLQPDIVYVSSLFEGWEEDAVTSVGAYEKFGKTAVTLYDLIPLLNEKTYLIDPNIRKFYYRKIESLKRADLLLSISEYSRYEGLNALHINPDQVINISTAVDPIFRPAELSPERKNNLLARYGIQKPFIMYTGGFDNRKNLPGLFEAFSLLPETIKNGYQLLIVGKATEGVKLYLKSLADTWKISNSVVIGGYIPDDDLIGLYNLCALFVFPSLYEGFGLPALEAMACGAPVIGSNTTSIPEVIGFSDALFNPTNPKEIAEKINQVLCDEGFRNLLREHGLKQAAQFNWQSSAKRALAAFENIVEYKVHIDRSFLLLNNNKRYSRLISSIADLSEGENRATNQDLLDTAHSIFVNGKTTDRATLTIELNEKINWRIEGPFDSSYSLSLLNRETARALAKLGHNVTLWSTEGPGDFTPNQEFLQKNSDLARMYELAKQTESQVSQVVSRNLYPPRVSDMQGSFNLLHHYAWEESGFPIDWVESFNQNLQGITCLSSFVEKVLIDNGVNVPLSTSGCGVDHWERITPDDKYHLKARKFRFLHVSSCFPRKGIDILLEAYGNTFTKNDDVSLIIKTFKNPHNHVLELLEEKKNESSAFPDVIVIEDDLTDPEMKSLYQQCDVMVGPSRGEGFGLPFAEAILSGIPVITTNWGGQLDFCTEKTAWLVDYKFEYAKTHFNLFDSVWAEPDISDLSNKMRELYLCSNEDKRSRTNQGRQLLLEQFKWENVVNRLVQSVRNWAPINTKPCPKIGWITTWNTKCGIATYSANLIKGMPEEVNILAAQTDALTAKDENNVTRIWTKDDFLNLDDLSELSQHIEESNIDTIVVQFNYSFFNFETLTRFLNTQLNAGRIVVIVFHSTTDPENWQGRYLRSIVPTLKRCHRLLVHSVNDLNRLKNLGLVDNVMLFPHGVLDYEPKAKNHSSKVKVIGSYGFFLPHKGLFELIKAIPHILAEGETVKLLMVNAEYPVPESAAAVKQARELIRELKITDNVELITEYLPDHESLDLLSQADIIVFPYQATNESSSAAVRYGLATGRPVAVTPLPIFDDVGPAVIKLPGGTPNDIAQGIVQALHKIDQNSLEIQQLTERASNWRKAHSYSLLSDRFYRILQALYQKQADMQTSSDIEDGEELIGINPGA